MEPVTTVASEAAAAVLSPLSGHPAMWSLVPLSVLMGIAMLWVFRRTSNPEGITRAKARVMAHLYELRLFPDEPVLIWKAQWGLLKANARYAGMMLIPVAVMALPMALLFSELECFYGYRPLEPGREAILTIQLKTAPDGAAPLIRPPDGIIVETEGVRLDGGRQISWRLRATKPATGKLQVVLPGEVVEKNLEAGAGPRYLSERRVSSAGEFLWRPAEAMLSSSRIDWIQVRYPEASIRAMGIELPWLAWMLVISMITALALKRRFGVVF